MPGMTASGRAAASDAERLASVLYQFVLMYQNHAAREDTIVFPAWKEVLSKSQYDEISQRVAQIEGETIGENGFADANRQIAEVEDALGFTDLAQFTVPPPPRGRPL